MAENAAAGQDLGDNVTFTSLNHISVPVRDRQEAVRFWTHIFGGKVKVDIEKTNFALISVPGGFDIGVSKRDGGWTGRTAEYPHYGLNTDPDKIEAIKAKLESYGVPTHAIWTRFASEGLMYFRDPSGNLFELYCHDGYKGAATAPVGADYGGNFRPDFEALCYDSWRDPGVAAA